MPGFGGGKPTIERRDVGASERGVMIGFWISKQDFRVSIPGTCRSICWAFRSLGRLGCFELEILNTRSLLSSDDLLTYCRDGVRIVVLQSVSGFLRTKSGQGLHHAVAMALQVQVFVNGVCGAQQARPAKDEPKRAADPETL